MPEDCPRVGAWHLSLPTADPPSGKKDWKSMVLESRKQIDGDGQR